MPWKETCNVAQYKGADWSNFIKTVPNCTPEKAKLIALKDPSISFFFFCRETIILEERGTFNPGDAVFFSGTPWYGSAPQCDSYQKEYMSVAYGTRQDKTDFLKPGCYTLSDGSPAVDVACIFAANLNMTVPSGSVRLAPDVNVPDGYPLLVGSPDILNTVLPLVPKLQEKGISVLLTVLGNHDAAGWSNFENNQTGQDQAKVFVEQLKTVVNKFGLDGIDIDDEYSSPDKRISTSLIMVTSYMMEMMPDKIISKALFSDSSYFSEKWNGKTLAENLTYGWEMTYGNSPQSRLPQYVNAGMKKDTLSLGFWSGQPSPDPSSDVQWIKDNHYEGVMVYAFPEGSNAALMGELVEDLLGKGNWIDHC